MQSKRDEMTSDKRQKKRPAGKENDYAQSYQRKEQEYGISGQCRTAGRYGAFYRSAE